MSSLKTINSELNFEPSEFGKSVMILIPDTFDVQPNANTL